MKKLLSLVAALGFMTIMLPAFGGADEAEACPSDCGPRSAYTCTDGRTISLPNPKAKLSDFLEYCGDSSQRQVSAPPPKPKKQEQRVITRDTTRVQMEASIAPKSEPRPAPVKGGTISLVPPKCSIYGDYVRSEPPALARFNIGTMCDKQFGLTNVKSSNKSTPTRGPNMCILRLEGTKDSQSFSCIIPVEQYVVVRGGAAHFVVRETTTFATKGQLLRYNPSNDRAL